MASHAADGTEAVRSHRLSSWLAPHAAATAFEAKRPRHRQARQGFVDTLRGHWRRGRGRLWTGPGPLSFFTIGHGTHEVRRGHSTVQPKDFTANLPALKKGIQFRALAWSFSPPLRR